MYNNLPLEIKSLCVGFISHLVDKPIHEEETRRTCSALVKTEAGAICILQGRSCVCNHSGRILCDQGGYRLGEEHWHEVTMSKNLYAPPTSESGPS